MIRKLHNTLIGLVTCSCLLLVGLLMAVPATPDIAPAGITPSLADLDAAEPALADAGPQDDEATPPARRTRHGRQTVAMPFFSFAPRG